MQTSYSEFRNRVSNEKKKTCLAFIICFITAIITGTVMYFGDGKGPVEFILITLTLPTILISGTMWLSRFFNYSSSEEMVRAQIKGEIRSKLDDLDRRLVSDGDKRTHRSLRDLRKLMTVMRSCHSQNDLCGSDDLFEAVENLFIECINSLEHSLKIQKAAMYLHDEYTKNMLLNRREKIIEDINKNIAFIGKIVADLQVLSVSANNEDHSEIRERISERIESVKSVRNQMERWRAGDFSDLNDKAEQVTVA